MEPYFARTNIHVCPMCSKQFGSRIALQRHSMVHSGERPYTCSFCRASFRCSSHLKRHERLHTGERPYACSLCSKRYADSTSLLRHAEAAHARLPYPCGHCDRAFSLERELRTHLETAHEIFLLPANGRARTLCENLLKRKSPTTTTTTTTAGAHSHADDDDDQDVDGDVEDSQDLDLEIDESDEGHPYGQPTHTAPQQAGEPAPNSESILVVAAHARSQMLQSHLTVNADETSPASIRPLKRHSPAGSDSECPRSLQGVPLSSLAAIAESRLRSPDASPLTLPTRRVSIASHQEREAPSARMSMHSINEASQEDEEPEFHKPKRPATDAATRERTNTSSATYPPDAMHDPANDTEPRLAPTRQRIPPGVAPATTSSQRTPHAAALPVVVQAMHLAAQAPEHRHPAAPGSTAVSHRAEHMLVPGHYVVQASPGQPQDLSACAASCHSLGHQLMYPSQPPPPPRYQSAMVMPDMRMLTHQPLNPPAPHPSLAYGPAYASKAVSIAPTWPGWPYAIHPSMTPAPVAATQPQPSPSGPFGPAALMHGHPMFAPNPYYATTSTPSPQHPQPVNMSSYPGYTLVPTPQSTMWRY
jgi:hypothetical protein